MFSVAAIVAIITGSQVLAQCDVKSGAGLALIGHAYLSLPAQDAHQCYEKCKSDEPKCRSLNYYGDSKFCELNNVTRTSHPGDLKENPVSVYFESRYRVTTGSQRSVAASSCQDILQRGDSTGNGFYWLDSNSTEDPYVTFCNMTSGGDTSASFDLIFKDRNTSNYLELETFFPNLSSFTVCLWFKSMERQLLFLSYATEPFTDAIMMFLSSTGLFRFLVMNEQTHGHTGTFEDKTWHHLCGTWANHDGVVRLFIDGDCKLTSNRTIHGVIPGTGKLILGQDQDIMGGAFDYQQSFVGEMSHLYIWNTDLGTSVISTLSMHCKEHPYPGYIVRWSDFTEAGIHGNITKRNNSRCLTSQDMLP
ncbi:unnamed protein product [Porites evermanni]|uniref:Apple domain-containing protein n=1 Tax=Porites evermanni TaxID=104178 RepID=A0ABN8PGK6_9CNID|nr:unnamed protein product [Porites evermanni]